MNLTLQRKPTNEQGCTFGQLMVDGVYFSETLEDPIREQEYVKVALWKVKGDTAIPAGKYTIIVDWSQRFNGLMPHLLGVDGFTGIRIHAGNSTADTEGCILVGVRRGGPGELPLLSSRPAFDRLFSMMKEAVKNEEKIVITVLNPPSVIEEVPANVSLES